MLETVSQNWKTLGGHVGTTVERGVRLQLKVAREVYLAVEVLSGKIY